MSGLFQSPYWPSSGTGLNVSSLGLETQSSTPDATLSRHSAGSQCCIICDSRTTSRSQALAEFESGKDFAVLIPGDKPDASLSLLLACSLSASGGRIGTDLMSQLGSEGNSFGGEPRRPNEPIPRAPNSSNLKCQCQCQTLTPHMMHIVPARVTVRALG